MKSIDVIAQALTISLTIGSSVPYIRGTLVGTIKPTRSSWIVWTTLDTVTLCGMFVKGVANVQIETGLIMSIFITASVLARTRSEPWGIKEKAYLALGFLGIALWACTDNASWAIVISLAVIEFALYFTLETIWKCPLDEPPLPWFLGGLSGVPILLTMKTYSLVACAQPVLWLVNNWLVAAIIIHRRASLPSK